MYYNVVREEVINLKILIIEDDKDISNILKAYFEKSEYKVDQAFDGQEALDKFTNNVYDLLILDLMLPLLSGEEVLEEVRKKSAVPIIILSAKTSEKNKLHGLISGADDYVTKPFSAKEVVARVNAILRRVTEYNNINTKNMYDNGKLKINFDKMEVTYDGKPINFTANELKVMNVFINNEDVVLSRDQIIDLAFEDNFDGYDRNIDTYIKNIRSKIGKSYISTIYSIGYKFSDKDGN